MKLRTSLSLKTLITLLLNFRLSLNASLQFFQLCIIRQSEMTLSHFSTIFFAMLTHEHKQYALMLQKLPYNPFYTLICTCSISQDTIPKTKVLAIGTSIIVVYCLYSKKTHVFPQRRGMCKLWLQEPNLYCIGPCCCKILFYLKKKLEIKMVLIL